MKLTDLPELYAQDGLGDEAIAYIKYFTPASCWTWYLTEYNESSHIAFGLVDGFEKELGYIPMTELDELIQNGMIERDEWFTPTRIGDLR